MLQDQRDERQWKRGVLADDRKFTQQTSRDATQQGYDLEKLMTGKQLDAAMAPAMEAAKVRGETPEGARKAITDIWKVRVAADLTGKGFAGLPINEQVKQAAELYKQQSAAARGVIGSGGAAAGGTPSLY